MNTIFLVTSASAETRTKLTGWFAARLSRVFHSPEDIAGKFRELPVAVVTDKAKPFAKVLKEVANGATVIRIHVGNKSGDDGRINHLIPYSKGGEVALFFAMENLWNERKGKRGATPPSVPA